MDKTQDLLLGVLTGQQYQLKYPGIEAYVVSLQKSGFSGRKVMIVWNVNPITRELLLKHGFEIVDLFPNWPSEPFFHARMRVAWEYLRDHSQEFRYVFWFDIKDFIFQSDPSVWMEQNIKDHKIIGSTECVTIEQEETNKLWAQTILGEKRFQEIKDEEVINGGTWAGTAEEMTEVFNQVHKGCTTYTGPYPPCQIWINYVLRQSPFKECLYIPRWSEGFAACLHPCWSPWRDICWPYLRDPHPTLDIDTVTLYPGTKTNKENPMVLFNGNWGRSIPLKIVEWTAPLHGVEITKEHPNKPFCVVHGYDRDWTMKSLFEYKYTLGKDRDEIDIRCLTGELQYLADMCPQPRSLRPRRFV
jgi:hypothetical protein